MKTIHDQNYIVLINCLKNIRRGKNLTQIELASFLNKDQSYVSKYERCERRLDFIELRYICKALDISMCEFINIYENELKKCGIE